MFKISRILGWLGIIKNSEPNNIEIEEALDNLSRITPPIQEESAERVAHMLKGAFVRTGQLGLYQSLLNRLQRQPVAHLPSWEDTDQVQPLPRTMAAPFSNIITPHGEHLMTTIWVLFYEDTDTVEIVTPEPSAGWSNTDGGAAKWETHCETPMPEGVTSAISITNGLSQTGHAMASCNWLLYKKQ